MPEPTRGRTTALSEQDRRVALASLLAALLVAGNAGTTATAEAESEGEDPRQTVLGTWRTANGRGLIEIYASATGEYRGRIANGAEDDRRDAKNPDPALRERPLYGLDILTGFRYAGEGRFTDGRIYDPSSGNVYRAQITVKGPDRISLRGYIGIPLLGSSEVWTRASDAPGAATPPAR